MHEMRKGDSKKRKKEKVKKRKENEPPLIFANYSADLLTPTSVKQDNASTFQ